MNYNNYIKNSTRCLMFVVFAVVILFTHSNVYAQVTNGITVKGMVTDATGAGLPGLTVAVKGTGQGTITNAHGNYSITVADENATLVFSFVGFAIQEIAIDGQSI